MFTVKVQISHHTSDIEPNVLIYDRAKRYFEIFRLSDCPGLEAAMADVMDGSRRAFFSAYVENGKFHLDQRVADEAW